MNKLLLYLVMLPSALWRSLGADTDQLRAILDLKLTLDDRKPLTLGRPQKKKSIKYGSILSALIYLGMGCMYILPLLVLPDRIFSITVFFTLLLSIITFMLITDFSNVLFDARDKYILFPRPVSDRTLVLARMLHIFVYLFRVVLPLSLPGWVTLGIADGWPSATLFIVPLLLLVFLALFLVNSVYLLVLRLAKPERFKDVINYFQVFTSVIFFGSVYILPRLFDHENLAAFDVHKYNWVRYMPTYWLAACWSWIGFPVILSGTAGYSVLAVAVPLICMYILVKILAPQFSSRIAGIDVADSGGYNPPVNGVRRKAPGRLYQRLANAFNRTDDARAGFMIGWLQTARSRSFRMRVYPSFALIPMYFVYLLTLEHTSMGDAMSHLARKPMHLFILYYSSFVMINALNYLSMSDQYKAAWIYYAAPLATPGTVMIGAFKAVWVKFFLPFYLLLSVFIIYVWGPAAIWDILLAMVNVTLFLACIVRVTLRHLPFSIIEQTKQGGGRIIKSLLAMSVSFVLGWAHYLTIATSLLWLKLLFLALSCILLWLVWTSYAATTWDSLIKGEME